MRPLMQRPTVPRRRLKVAAAAAMIIGLTCSPAVAGCPWIVQPSDAIGDDLSDYDITFDGEPNPSWAYYAFTVTDRDLAWELSSGSGIDDVDHRARPLLAFDDAERMRYRADRASVMPLTLYLVVSTAPLPELDAIAAGFEPKRPVALGFRMRGASDASGPLPHRSLPGIEIQYTRSEPAGTELETARPDYQLCAYQVLIR